MVWYREGRWGDRLLAEQELMKSRFPQFRLVETAASELRWIGWLEPVLGHRFLVSLRYPSSYPYASPDLFLEEPAMEAGAPHVYSSGACCVHKARWNPETGTAVSCVPLLSAWLARYLTWLACGEF